MRVPLEWLREYCDPELEVGGIEERLTMTGTKVEAIHHHGVGAPERFVVGRVLTCERHPDADRLSVCEVDLGPASPDGPAKIVCGAPNVAAGQTVAVACPGAVMPDGMRIKRAKLRGVVSEGMICAERELAIGPGGEGILVLDDLPEIAEGHSGGLAPGTPLAEVLPIATEVIELEVTPNRPDCLGVYGVARELHAATGAPLAPEPWREDPGSAGALRAGSDGAPPAEVEVRCPDLCPRFTARAFESVRIAQSPPWLKARLSAAGQRPINNVVDITNYAMLLTGQPLHAFDLDRVAGGRLVVRRAHEGERVQTLDGQTRTLDGEMVVIEDGEGPTSIAGLMGGSRSEVGEGTTRVLLEVANWHGPNIHRTSWALGLRSEASSRFEKGLAPEQCMWAQAVAGRLMIELCGAKLLPGTIDVGGEEAGRQPGDGEGKGWSSGKAIRLREARVQAILGVPVPVGRQAEILRALDFAVDPTQDGLDVTPPPVRREDVTREADLIEEVARIDGLEKLPATLPKRRGAYGLLTWEQRQRRRVADALVGWGCYEVVGWTFTAPSLADRLQLDADDVRRRAPIVENPLSAEQSRLRTTLLGSLLDTAAHNAARGTSDLSLFEIGTVFSAAPPEPATTAENGATAVAEHRSLAVLLAGGLQEQRWGVPQTPQASFFAVKGVLEALASVLRVGIDYRPGSEPFLDPGRTASVWVAQEQIGWVGTLHPLLARDWEVPAVSMFELDLDRLLAAAPTQTRYEEIVGYPSLYQDLAVVMPDAVPVARVLATMRAAAGGLLRNIEIFDVYSGPQIGEGRRSLGFGLAFQAPDRTLSEEDVAPLRERIVAALLELGGELRA
jgi:phenylalanyl-tRNA synthetase beta chain